MPTLVDSLYVEFGLDPKKFTDGQKKVLQAIQQTQKEALRAANQQESIVRRINASIERIQTAAKGVLGALGVYDIKQFVVNLANADAALGRTATLLGTTTEQLSAWRNVVANAGGSAEGFTAGIANLTQQFEQWRATGQSGMIPYLRALRVNLSDARGQLRPFSDILLELADKFQNMSGPEASFFGRSLGLDETTIYLLRQGRAAVQNMVEEQKKLGVVTKENFEASQLFVKNYNALAQVFTTIGRGIFNAIAPSIIQTLHTDIRDLLKLAEIAGNIGGFLDRTGTQLSLNRNQWNAIETTKQAAAPGLGGVIMPAPKGGDNFDTLRVKPGAFSGRETLGVKALALSLQSSLPGYVQATGGADAYHQGEAHSLHNAGLALDFAIKGGSKEYAATAAKLRAMLAAMGVNANVIDEMNHPSRNATGPHIHVGFRSAADAQRYYERSQGGTFNTNSVNIGTINVNAPNAKDGPAIAQSLGPALRQNAFANQGQTGNN